MMPTLIDELDTHQTLLSDLDAQIDARYKSVVTALKLQRLDKGIAAKEVAERAGISAAHLSHIEAGRHRPSLSTLRQLTDALR